MKIPHACAAFARNNYKLPEPIILVIKFAFHGIDHTIFFRTKAPKYSFKAAFFIPAQPRLATNIK